jgi:hypothetical protein
MKDSMFLDGGTSHQPKFHFGLEMTLLMRYSFT